MSALAERRAAARARAAEMTARDEALPAALCGACGALVRTGEGVAYPRSPWAPQSLSEAQEDAERIRNGQPPILSWTRRHDRCATSVGVVAQLVGIELPAEVASEALSAASGSRGLLAVMASARFRDAPPRDRRPKAWAHLSDEDRARLARAVDRARAEVEPRRCVSGACAWCGVSHSIGWRTSPETWRDGSAAPLCSSCADTWISRTRPTEREELRAAALEAATGVRSWSGEGIYVYADVATDDRTGTAEPWQYAPEAIAALRERLSPAAAQRRREAAEAEQAAADAAEESQRLTEARAAGWPV